MTLLERITVRPGQCGGKPCIRGMRIRVTDVLGLLAHGLTAAPLANRYAAWFESHPRDAVPGLEGSEVADVRWRRAGIDAGVSGQERASAR